MCENLLQNLHIYHFSGHPIVGDYTYSNRSDTEPHRMMLHALSLHIPLCTIPSVNAKTTDHLAQEALWVVKDKLVEIKDVLADET